MYDKKSKCQTDIIGIHIYSYETEMIRDLIFIIYPPIINDWKEY